MKKILLLLLGFIISWSLISGIFSQIEVDLVINSIKNANFFLIFIALLFYLTALVTRSERWHLLLKKEFMQTRKRVLRVVVIGYVMNWLFPIKIGEVARPILLAGHEKNMVPLAAGTVIVERVMDGAILSILFLLGASTSLDIIYAEFGSKGLWIPLGIIIVVLCLFIASIYLRRYMESKDSRLSRVTFFVPRVKNKLDSFFRGLTIWKHQTYFIGSAVLTIISWFLETVSYWLIGLSLGIELTIMQFFLVLWAATFGFIIPNAGAGLGTFEFFTAGMLAILGIDNSTATACALLLHALILFPLILLAIPSVIYERDKIDRVRSLLSV
ncbi:MAG: lysylphosphatidylglycerol synthase transmembrane domain-containing protein [Dehalococcoidia bacterium]